MKGGSDPLQSKAGQALWPPLWPAPLLPDPGIDFGFYYLSFRHPEIKNRFKRMIQGFRNYLVRELEQFIKCGIIKTKDAQTASDIIVTLMEGLEFHTHFLSEGQPFENFARIAKKNAFDILKGEIVQTSLNEN
jgi:hypothetical protein